MEEMIYLKNIVKMDRTSVVLRNESDGDVENDSHSAWVDGGMDT